MRGLAYRRAKRESVINRKVSIIKNSMWGTVKVGTFSFDADGTWYKHRGQYDKGKIHCGCETCKCGKKYGLPTIRTERELEKFNTDLSDYYSNINVLGD